MNLKSAAIMLLLTLAPLALAQRVYDYRVIERKPQDRSHYVQGLEIADGKLYLSAGGYGESRLLRYDFDSGALEISRRLHPRLFAEGLTLFGDHLYQLTWRARAVLVYDRDTLEFSHHFRIPGEGWGITHDGGQLVYSDGSDQLHFLSPESETITHSIRVTENGSPVKWLNELEWIDGKIWANVWGTDRILVIDPASGVVSAAIDLAGILPTPERRPDTEVLNGIARDPRDGGVWVTGKRWPWMYRIELVAPEERAEKGEAAAGSR